MVGFSVRDYIYNNFYQTQQWDSFKESQLGPKFVFRIGSLGVLKMQKMQPKYHIVKVSEGFKCAPYQLMGLFESGYMLHIVTDHPRLTTGS